MTSVAAALAISNTVILGSGTAVAITQLPVTPRSGFEGTWS
jgi:hypothetical protein